MLIHKSEQRHRGEKGVAIVLATFTIIMLGGLIGLAIDGGIAFFLKARLGQAMDAASLAGARSLSRGTDVNSQAANATAVAKNYFSANFPSNFWGCTVNTPTVNVWEDTVNTHIRYVQVTGSVTTPLYFMRVLGFTTASLSSTATAQRRDVNIMLVLDRSFSMGANGAIGPSVTAAVSFVNDFAPGRDKLGAVIFGGNYYLYQPTVNFQPSLVNAINQTASKGNTGTAQALWAAYKQLVLLNEPGSLNLIVFFTDGLPNGISADMSPYRVKTGAKPAGNGLTPACGDGSAQVGWFAQGSGFATTGNANGLFLTTTPGNIVDDGNDGTTSEFISNNANCIFKTTNNAGNIYQDFKQLPYYDQNGMPTSGISPNFPNNGGGGGNGVVNTWTSSDLTWANTSNMYYKGFTQAWLNTASGGCTTPGGQVPPNNFGGSGGCGLQSPWILGMASANAADFAAQRWRHADTETALNNIIPKVFGITLTQPTGERPDPMFMLRVTNVPSGFANDGVTPITNVIYDSTKPTGQYTNTASAGELQQLFQAVASQILHLSQ